MDKGIVVTTGNKAYVKEFDAPLYKAVRPVLNGYFESVHPRGLPEPYVMLVNDEGLIRDMKPNYLGCLLYGTAQHGWPICGNLIFFKIGYRDGERDIIGLDDEDIAVLQDLICRTGAVKWEGSDA